MAIGLTRRLRRAGRIAVLLGAAGGAAALPPATGLADAGAGRAVYDRCLACHSEEHDRVGPRHCGLNGRPAGSLAGFDYSPAMKASGIVWDRRSLDAFIAAPVATVPGTTMTYDGIKDAGERAALIDYLLSIPPCN